MHTHKTTAPTQETIPPSNTDIFQQALSLHQQGRVEQAEVLYEQQLKNQPQHIDALHFLGVLVNQRGQSQRAVELISQALEIAPNNAAAHSNLGLALQELKRFDEAIASYDRSLALKPNNAEAHYNRGNALLALTRFDEAILDYERALAIKPDYAQAFSNLGNVLLAVKRYDQALASYESALTIKPDFAEALAGRGAVLNGLKRFTEALSSYEHALAIKPDLEFILGTRLYTKMSSCQWHEFNHDLGELTNAIERGEKVSIPFTLQAVSSSAALQKKVAEIYTQTKHPSHFLLPPLVKHSHSKIKIGYFSSDFYSHAVAYQTAELFERHDRSRFEIIAFSFHAARDKDDMRLRLEAAFDQFVDVSGQSDEQVVRLARQLEIDIAVDLNGYTEGCRTDIFALRAAPIQVNYIGYLGTMGADYIDYLLADRVLIPTEHQAYYNEFCAYLPHSFQVNDSKLSISDKVFTRAELGLPEQGVVFCCFNSHYKITPTIFTSWMRILRDVENSVLWLVGGNVDAESNLRLSATAHGIAAQRLVFAQRVPMPEYLACHRLADLFLDTSPYNAGATASAALWAGLPLITFLGTSYSSRMAASLLNAIGLPELVTQSMDDYETLAIQLATHPEQLAAVKQKLADNRLTTPLFNTALFTQYIESAFQMMFDRYRAGLAPDHLYVPDDVATNLESIQQSQLTPDSSDKFQRAVDYHQQGLLAEAEQVYKEILQSQPQHADSLHLLGVIAKQRGQAQLAVDLINQSLNINPNNAAAYSNIGLAYQELNRFELALASYNRALSLEPHYADAYFNRGNLLLAHKEFDEALSSYDKTLAINPNHTETLFSRGIVLKNLNRLDQALASYECALSIKPDYIEALINKANVLQELKRYDEALASCEHALAIKPEYAEALFACAVILQDMKRFKEAITFYERAFTIKSDMAFMFGDYLHIKMNICDWTEFDTHLNKLANAIEGGEKVAAPFTLHSIYSSAELLKKASETYAKQKYPSNFLLPPLVKNTHSKIKLAYFSSDFRNHPVAHLIAELLERHDRTRFEIIAFSFSPVSNKDAMRVRLEVSFDQFIDVSQLMDKQIVQLARQIGCDIAVDLNGFTANSRTGIFAMRVAPIQVSYLGFLGTMGTDYMHYLLADSTLIPTEHQRYYSEKIAYLPHSFQVNDSKLSISDKIFTRTELNLPEQDFVFCCFNSNYKITPAVFESWMRILGQVEGSVLWLLEDNDDATENLRAEAASCGIDAERIVFAKKLTMSEHLARQKLADLFFDTSPYNAGATASAALLAGLPILTYLGETFSSRMAASLLYAIGLPELVTQTPMEYEVLAIQLATHPEQLAAIKQKLADNRLTTPLFNTALFTQHIESAFQMMFDRYQAGLAPDHLYVPTQIPAIKIQQQPLPTIHVTKTVVIENPTEKSNPPSLLAKIAQKPAQLFAAIKVFGKRKNSPLAKQQTLTLTPAEANTLEQAQQLHHQGQLAAAELLYQELLKTQPKHPEALRCVAMIKKQRQTRDIVDSSKQTLPAHSDSVQIHFNEGLTLQNIDRLDETAASVESTLVIEENTVEELINRGNELEDLGYFDAALASYDRALFINTNYARAHSNRGNVLQSMKRIDEALASYDQALTIRSDYPEAFYNRGNALLAGKRFQEAIASYDRALRIKPDFIDALIGRGNALFDCKQFSDALISYERVLSITPNYAEACYNCGKVLHNLERFDEALASYQRALIIKPDYIDALIGQGNVSQDLKRFNDAINSYERVLTIKPNSEFMFCIWLSLKMKLCDWREFDTNLDTLQQKITRGEKAFTPFFVQSMSSSPALQRKAASIYAQAEYPSHFLLPPLEKHTHSKIKLAYFSADFRNHAVAYLSAELFERHDRARFEIIAFSLHATNHKDDMRLRLETVFDQFIDVSQQSDEQVVRLARKLEIDIAVDLNGFTEGCRPNLFAMRVAPIQVNYLGYSGTMGVDYMDYILADSVVIPTECQSYYTEKIAYLPNSYLVNDTHRPIANRQFTRAEFGLPEHGFVFCCFNHAYKITPTVFDIWMRLLHSIEGSVLWLSESNADAVNNLQREAKARNIEPTRLIFAKRLASLPDHLARHRLADLFLDTLPYNAHTTASDALWVGLPVLTCVNLPILTCEGVAFASRVAASLLSAVGLPELITTNLDDYQALAIQLATHPDELAALKQKLVDNRLTTPLFDTELFTQHIESAFQMMFDRYQAGLAPDHISVETQSEDIDTVTLPTTSEQIIEVDTIEALINQGNDLEDLNQLDEALACYDRALSINPNYARAHSNRGNVLQSLKRFDDAIASYNHALVIKPDYAEAFCNRGNALQALSRFDEALSNYDKALAIKPNLWLALIGRGTVLQNLNRYQEMLSVCDQLLAIQPDSVETLINRGNVLQILNRFDEALSSYERALTLKPDHPFLLGTWLHNKMRLCDWSGFETNREQLIKKITLGIKASTPFPVLALTSSAAIQQTVARYYVQEKYPSHFLLPPLVKHAHSKIKIAYFSADFRIHVTAQLIAELFDRHDRSRFEIIAFSFHSASHKDAMRLRLEAAFDQFIDVSQQSDEQVVRLARQLEIDIAVDLKGFTEDARPNIFAMRAAPIQVSYLGYPSTMGADYIDYLLADSVLIPKEYQPYYSEFCVYLPNSYQVNDTSRVIANRQFTRAELDLPEQGFVFCCFNNNYKITPAVFDSWMRILHHVEDSVLWLLEDNAIAAKNCRLEAVARGINPERIVFAQRVALPEHLARHRLADLFLDTLPCNAHTTTSDALWAGLPVLTCMGEAFASRVAASLLSAIGLPELITSNHEDYEALAIQLATHSEQLAALKQKLADNHLTTPLFNTALFTQHIESAFQMMFDRYQADLAPDHIYVPIQEQIHTTQQQAVIELKPLLASDDKFQQVLSLHQQGQFAEAEVLYEQLLKTNPQHVDALHFLGILKNQHGQAPLAIDLIQQSLNINPNNAEAHLNLALALQTINRFDEALASYDRALTLKPDYDEALFNRANLLLSHNYFDQALANYDQVLAINPNYVEVLCNRGVVLQGLQRFDDALASYNRALALKPNYAEVITNRGNTLKELKRFNDALDSYDRALVIVPDDVETLSNRGNILQELRRLNEALNSYDRALEVNPNYPEALSNRATVLCTLKRYDEALASYERALVVNPNYTEALLGCGVVLQELKRFSDAIIYYERALAIQPDHAFLFGTWLSSKMKMCDWKDLVHHTNKLVSEIEQGKKIVTPFSVLAMTSSAALQKKAAEIYSQTKYPSQLLLPPLSKHTHSKIKIAYFSADFRNHPIAYLMAELFEYHDHSRFEVIAFSLYAADHKDEMRLRLEPSFDQFIDVSQQSDEQVVRLARQLGCDIAVDLNGFTEGGRTNIFAMRVAPIQVSYLGYASTMGSEYIDYLLADPTLIPSEYQPYYTEKIAYLPNSYMSSDSKRFIANRSFTRAELGLPAQGFVFCCFNNNHKITSAVFDSWMRLLHQVEGSVLWLLEDNAYVAKNCRLEAAARGINPERICFAQRMAMPEYLARYRLADLFLDTLPYNAHTTTNDALWVGLPVLTCMGEAFASRVAASLLNAIGLPELITSNYEDYEALAIQLATHPEQLAALKQKLADNHLTTPLFNTALFAKHIESAFQMMFDRYQAGLAPDHIYVSAHKTASPLKDWQSLPANADKFQQALSLHQQGQLEQAEVLYQEILHTEPQHVDVLHFLGVLKNQKGQPQRAVELIQQSLTINTNNSAAYSNLGAVFQALNRFDDALICYDKVLELSPDSVDALLNQANLLQTLNRPDEALIGYNMALTIKPDFIDALIGRGITLQVLNRFDAALINYDLLLSIDTHHAEALFGQANTLYNLKRLEESLSSYDRSLAINPNSFDALYNRGVVLADLNRVDEAIVNYQRALVVKPDYVEVHNNLGLLLKKQHCYSEAEASYQRAIAIKPDYSEAHCNLITLLKDQGQLSQAEISLQTALTAIPDNTELHFIQLIMSLPVIPKSAAASILVPSQFDDALSNLSNWINSSASHQESLHKAELLPLPFLLAYRAGNHVQRLSRYGDLVTSPSRSVSVKPLAKKIRMVVISHHFRRHSVWDVITRGLLVNLDRSRFELILYHLGKIEDQETAFAKSLANEWRDTHTITELAGWLTALETDAADVIFYPEIGMDPLSARLASHRFATLQIASWGHPITTGLSTIDLYFSGELLESPNADSHYRERLIRLPNTGCCTTPINILPEPLSPELVAQLTASSSVRFIIAQTIYKFDPVDDALYATIASVVHDSVFILLGDRQDTWATDQIVARLEQCFVDRGLNPKQHLLVIPWQSMEKFQTLLDLCDVYLDCPSFSGYTTAWQAVHRGLPIVTLEGEFMRQRLAAGLLRKIGLTDTIASSREDYVQIAAKLAEECRNPKHHATRRHALKTAAPKVDNDVSVVRAFEQSVINALVINSETG
ncbi:MAG: tetratricopeptide repeat protein [Methylococcales bacterium]|nr:tetratricopeptide repeat protein [Methylococcales bacterium]